MILAIIVSYLVIGYAMIGIAFAICFASVGVATLDASARGAPFAFRLLIIPGAAGLWPYLLVRWIRARQNARASHQRPTHGQAAS